MPEVFDSLLADANGAETLVLVFTRKKGESLIIGNEIEVTILNIGAGNVKIGIAAPRHISVHRHEVYEAIKRENVAATRSQIPSPEVLKKLLG
jgi:carbon storage regulator